ncbi:MAG: 2,3,4,5-tetrahydropyridine-2,6-dicarboxylate N-acetyltransferase [Eubacteriales Family XIII. Incertae Sedis bacterium]|nr:MAG: 2,3,4,5-tetrahydropyridine-2,6-dicarboxylate N-acetyltransferase [Clostridiales Family XIII bacterium]
MYDAKSIIEYIRTAKKSTPVKAYIKLKDAVNTANGLPFTAENAANEETHKIEKLYETFIARLSESCRIFECGKTLIVFGEMGDIESAVIGSENAEEAKKQSAGAGIGNTEKLIEYMEIETQARNSAVPLLDISKLDARVEPGAIIRENVSIGKQAVIMMGAIINIGAEIGARTMIDMGAVLGGRAVVGCDCHIGAGAVLAGVIEPASAKPVVIEDGVFIGANAVVIEGCRIGRKSVIGAGAVVTDDIPPHSLVVGAPGRVIKTLTGAESSASEIIKELREL